MRIGPAVAFAFAFAFAFAGVATAGCNGRIAAVGSTGGSGALTAGGGVDVPPPRASSAPDPSGVTGLGKPAPAADGCAEPVATLFAPSSVVAGALQGATADAADVYVYVATSRTGQDRRRRVISASLRRRARPSCSPARISHRVIDSASTDIGGRFDGTEGGALSYASTMGIVEVR